MKYNKMKPVSSTAEILLHKMLGHNVDERWVGWAYDMLCAGFDTGNLVQLAGETAPYNQFELKTLSDKIFTELNLDWNDHDQVYANYINNIVAQALNGEMKPLSVLEFVKDLYLQNDYEPLLQDFYLLYYAYDDLRYSDQQWHWDGATRENIDEMTKGYFKDWLTKYSSSE
jgi:hypothetical protein